MTDGRPSQLGGTGAGTDPPIAPARPLRLLQRPVVQWALLVLVLMLVAWTAWSVWSERGAGFCYNYMIVHNQTLDQLCSWREGLKWTELTGLTPATPPVP